MSDMTRRRLLQAGTGSLAAATFSGPLGLAQAADSGLVTLKASSRTLDVHGKPARVFAITNHNDVAGLVADHSGRLRIKLVNDMGTDTLIHWHGLTPPSDQDGVPGLSQPPLMAGESYDYDFMNNRTGTHWMHSHLGLQEQQLSAAPLIVRDPDEAHLDEQEVVLLLHDFSFRAPEEIFEELRQDAGMAMTGPMDDTDAHGEAGHGDMAPEAESDMTMDGTMDESMDMDMDMDHGGGDAGTMIHFNDVEYDAYLANDRTLADPEVVRVEPGGQIRLRIINAAAATNYLIDLGALNGELIAVDGNPVVPLQRQQIDLAIAQRADIRLCLPAGQGAYPILARREDGMQQTGIVLATKSGRVGHLPSQAEVKARPLDLMLEWQLSAASAMAERDVQRTINLDMTGSHSGYNWGFNGKAFNPADPIVVAEGERVEINLRNMAGMPHPIHLHGHHFQVVAIDGERLSGAVRDTVLVPPQRSVTVAFDADNPGHWALHCHQLYHMVAGMMTSVRYEGYSQA